MIDFHGISDNILENTSLDYFELEKELENFDTETGLKELHEKNE